MDVILMKILMEFLLFCRSCDDIFGVMLLYIHCKIAFPPEFEDKNITKYQQGWYETFMYSFFRLYKYNSFFSFFTYIVSCWNKLHHKILYRQWRVQRIKERVNASQEIFHSFLLFHCLITNLFCEHSCCYNFWMQQKCNWDYQL